ncbi:MAG: penicillin-insensitive murein endopeptidase, partial [Polyangiales bacterium]
EAEPGAASEGASDEATGPRHKVAAGETLSGIAKHYGVTIDAILERNPNLDRDRIREGQQLAIGDARRSVQVTVQPGDTLTSIARAQEVSVLELQRWNPRLAPDHIRAGQQLVVFPKKPASLSESVGLPGGGQLVHARRLPPGPGYVVRAPERAYATDETVRGIMQAFDHLRRADPKAPRVWVHDLSLRRGGPMTEHRSHQSGRDADIAYVQKRCDGVCDFHRVEPEAIDAARTFGLLKYWLERDELEAVFIDYRLQAPLYQYARSQGATAEQLQRWFQYPHGRDYPLGVIRHFRNHFDHMHVRFACHASDAECRTYRPLLLHTASR